MRTGVSTLTPALVLLLADCDLFRDDVARELHDLRPHRCTACDTPIPPGRPRKCPDCRKKEASP